MNITAQNLKTVSLDEDNGQYLRGLSSLFTDSNAVNVGFFGSNSCPLIKITHGVVFRKKKKKNVFFQTKGPYNVYNNIIRLIMA